MVNLPLTTETAWVAPPRTLVLGPGRVHVWRVSLRGWSPGELAELKQMLSPDEELRAARFHFQRDRERFVVARGVLRRLLGRYLQIAPAAVRFAYSSYGKPSVAAPATTLRFNLSHSHELALLAVAEGQELGVDIEYQAAARAEPDMTRQFCAPAELATLASLPPELWATGFYTVWTRKEAFIKAHGEGLSLPLTRIAVSLLPGEPARLIHSHDPADLDRWSLHALEPAPEYAAALAVAGQATAISRYSYDKGGNLAAEL